jgi:hypothetical protein
MTMGKIGLLGSVAVVAITLSGVSAMAQDNGPVATNAELQARIDALEAEVQQSEMNAAAAANAPPPPAATGWWSNTSITGRAYFDVSNIDEENNGVKATTATNAANGVTNGNGTNFDLKRFYVGIDHTFDPIFSANITTDVTYDGTTGVSQIFIKKAYLQAKIVPELTVRMGSADLPWVPYMESLYGYRYLEKTMIDRTSYGTSADWGIHALGSTLDGILNYQFSAVNGGGYKKAPIGGDANRFNQLDYEGRVSAVYDGFNLGVGGYTGKLGTVYGVPTYHSANRVDAVGAYVGNGIRIGLEYFNATDYSAALVQSATSGDSAHGLSAFGSYQFLDFLPQVAVFGRYEYVDPNAKTAPNKEDQFFTAGLQWSPTKIVDLSLAYKHEYVRGGAFSGSNGAIGATTGAMNGQYSEVGIFGDLQW